MNALYKRLKLGQTLDINLNYFCDLKPFRSYVMSLDLSKACC